MGRGIKFEVGNRGLRWWVFQFGVLVFPRCEGFPGSFWEAVGWGCIEV